MLPTATLSILSMAVHSPIGLLNTIPYYIIALRPYLELLNPSVDSQSALPANIADKLKQPDGNDEKQQSSHSNHSNAHSDPNEESTFDAIDPHWRSKLNFPHKDYSIQTSGLLNGCFG